MQITQELVLFMLTVLGVVLGAWWRVEGKIKEAEKSSSAKAEAASAQALLIAAQLAEHKLHVAETYITKAGMREFRDEVMTGVRELKGSVSTLHERIDQLILADRPVAKRQARAP